MEKFIEDIKNNYRKLEHELVTQLSYEVGHSVTMGTNREEIWVDFFRRIVPKKFNIARSVFIIDSYGNCSNEVDIAIYDEQYIPYIFNYGVIKFIPIEAVAAAVQCKSKTLKPDILNKWKESITQLETSPDSIARIVSGVYMGIKSYKTGVQTATTPIKILCYISEENKKNQDKNAKKGFDIVIQAYQRKKNEKNSFEKIKSDHSGNLDITFQNDSNLYEVLCRYNRKKGEGYEGYSIKEKDNGEKNIVEMLKQIGLEQYAISDGTDKYSLLSFIFQFNQMLMMINNPMFFPHMAYVEMFNGKKAEGCKKFIFCRKIHLDKLRKRKKNP